VPPVELPEVLIDLEEDGLRDVPRVLPVAHHPEGHVEEHPLVPVDELPECPPITFHAPVQQQGFLIVLDPNYRRFPGKLAGGAPSLARSARIRALPGVSQAAAPCRAPHRRIPTESGVSSW